MPEQNKEHTEEEIPERSAEEQAAEEEKRRKTEERRRAEEQSRFAAAKERARRARWLAKTKSRVSHPRYGAVIVPHLSKLAAIENAAEFWKCKPSEISDGATVSWVPDSEGPVRRPKEFFKKRRGPEYETSGDPQVE